MSGAQVTAVVVTYNSSRAIEECLASLKRCAEAGLLKVVIVDNCSTDGTRDRIERERSWAEVVHSPGNIGYGRGNNLGFERVTTPYVAVVNPDAVLEPGTLTTLVEFLEKNASAGIVAPALIEEDGGLQEAGALPTPGSILRGALPKGSKRIDRRAIQPGEEPRRVEWVCGALFVARTELMKRLGGFDPRFFLYWEETDLCRRALATGAEIWTVGAAVSRHVGGGAALVNNAPRYAGCIPKHYFESRYYYLKKHFGGLAAAAAEVGEYVLIAVGALLGPRRGQWRARRLGPVMKTPGVRG